MSYAETDLRRYWTFGVVLALHLALVMGLLRALKTLPLSIPIELEFEC